MAEPSSTRGHKREAPTPALAEGAVRRDERTLSPTVTEADLEDGSALAALLEDIRRFQPDEISADVSAVERAFEVAARAHAPQRRKSGEPYLVHPVRVARTLAQLGLDVDSVIGGLLHDAVEDSELTVYDVSEQFGRGVATIVDGVTKLGKVPYLSRQEQQAESFRKMLVAMSEDIRVLVVKLIDRLDNMQTLEHMPADKQERISRETMQIYAPLAGRLGLEWVRRDLQDLSFSYLEPAEHESIRTEIDSLLARHPGAVDRTVASLASVFDPARSNLPEDDDRGTWPYLQLGPVDVHYTLRPPYRVHRRLQALGRRVEQLSDVVTFQVVTRDRAACYAALGQLHAEFQPVPGRFRDYIALPRPNHYRALHTSVIDRDGARIEVQIRSREMDAIAERGIIAQWRLGRRKGRDDAWLSWLAQLMDWQSDVQDPHEFIEAVKADLFADEVYIFTPRGDIHTFPKGATPIDFAFAIHTDVGMHCSGARVNGHVVPLRYRLRQGDTVEILTNPSVGPREEWLKMCASPRARAKIKHYLRQKERQRLRTLGRSLLEQEMTSQGAVLEDFEKNGALAKQLDTLGVSRERGVDGVYEAVGSGQLGARAVIDSIGGPSRSEPSHSLLTRMFRRMAGKTQSGRGRGLDDSAGERPSHPIVVTRERVEGKGGGDALIALAPCCSPIPGDALIGIFEPGRGIAAHVEDCPEALEQVSGRRVYLEWETGLEIGCPVTIEVRTMNTVGLLAEMSRAFSAHSVNIRQANCRAQGVGGRAVNTFHATVHRLDQLHELVTSLRAIEGVVSVERRYKRETLPSAS